MLTNEEAHFASFNFPPHTWYRKNVFHGTTWHIYDWERIVTCVIQEGGSIILNDYMTVPVYTTIYRDIVSVINTLRLIFMPTNDLNRLHALAISQTSRTLRKKELHGSLVLTQSLHMTSIEYLLYLNYKVDEQTNTVSW